MQHVRKDETGNRYGRLTVEALQEVRRGAAHWRCRCDCGNERVVYGYDLRSGHTQSCGCLQAERTGNANTKHGMSRHAAYQSYFSALARCTNSNIASWARYGGRGIEFLLPPFEEFWAAMGSTWFEGATIERVDNDGHYELGNVRWATSQEQMANTSRTQRISFGGKTQHVSAWAREVGVSSDTLVWRIENWGVERALTTKPNRDRLIEHEGRAMSIRQWAKEIGISPSALSYRIKKWPLQKAMTHHIQTKRNHHDTSDTTPNKSNGRTQDPG